VEENANLVVRLLIRRPECLGPALRGEGGGLLKGMTGSIVMSLQIVAARDQDTRVFLRAVTEMKDDDRGDYLQQRYCHAPTLAGHSAIRPSVCPRAQLPRRRLPAAEVLSRPFAFSDLTLLTARQEGHPACKNRVVGCWRGYLSGARCRLVYGPADATAAHCLLFQ